MAHDEVHSSKRTTYIFQIQNLGLCMGMDIRVWDNGWNKLNQAEFIYRLNQTEFIYLCLLGRGSELNVVLQGDLKGFLTV